MNYIILGLKKFLPIFCLVILTITNISANNGQRPNIIIVMADNVGYGDFGLSGNTKVRTPNIDKFAEEGIQFTRFYCNLWCAPTRASIMTGRSHYRTGVIHTSRGGAKMHSGEITIGEYLQKAGYSTGIFGKWHLGNNYPMRPQDQGFSQVLWFRSASIGHVPDYPNTYNCPVLWCNGEKIKTEGYCTDVFFNAAIKFIESNRDNAFFVYLPTNVGLTANEEVVGPLVPSKFSDPYKEMGLSDNSSKVYGMMTNLDENFARLIEKLDELGIRENTIVIFTTDDGPAHGYNAGMRSGALYEARIRVPFAIQWPEGFSIKSAVIDKIASHIDVLPTLLDACGLEIPVEPVIDGVSLIPLLTGRNIHWEERDLFFQGHRGLEPQKYQNCVVVGQRYKMIGYPGTSDDWNLRTSPENPVLELYDLLEDPGEEINIAEKHPEIIKSLRIAYERWFEDVKGTRQFTPGWIHIGSDFEDETYLCRYQDASYPDADKPTGWPVVIERGGRYEVEINRGSSNARGWLYVKTGHHQDIVKPLKKGENRALVYLPEGRFNLNIWYQNQGEPYIPVNNADLIGDVILRRIE